MYYKLPNAHQPMQNPLPAGGEGHVQLTDRTGARQDLSPWIRQCYVTTLTPGLDSKTCLRAVSRALMTERHHVLHADAEHRTAR